MFDKIKYRIKMLSILKPFAKGVKKFYLLCFVLSLLGLMLSFVQPIFYKIFIDNVILSKELSKLVYVVIGYLSVFAINTIIGYIKYYSNNRLVNRVTFKIKLSFWNRLFKENFSSYETQSIGDTKMRIDDDINCIKSFFDAQTIGYTINYMTLIFSLLFMIIIKWQLALFSITLIPITFLLDHIISKKEWKMNDKIRENDQEQSSWLHATIQGWREVKALNLQKYEEKRLIKFTHIFSKYYIRSNNYNVTRIFVLPKIKDEFLMQFSLYFIGGLLIIGGEITIGTLLIFVQYCNMFTNAVRAVSLTDADLQSERAASDRLISGIEKINIRISNKGITPNDSNTIDFKDVSFIYPQGERYIFENFNLHITTGERIAITGKSGCGKTTLLKLLTGIIQPTQGRILFSGVDMRDIDLSEMHKRIGFVMQENMLFNVSIRENLLYGKSNVTDDDLREACQKACIYDFIQSLPEKYETIIGEKGIKLSGGQKQRIVLARLFLRQVDIFIFDEATSALDQYSESIIHDVIKNIGQDKTIIIVAHRKSSLSLCDRIIQLNNPKAVGIHEL